MKNIVLIGYMGSGKTTVGKVLSKKLQFKFIDCDKLIENTENLSIPEIFRIYKEKYFRNLENSLIDKFIKKKFKNL